MTFIGSKIVQKKLRILNTLCVGVVAEWFWCSPAFFVVSKDINKFVRYDSLNVQ